MNFDLTAGQLEAKEKFESFAKTCIEPYARQMDSMQETPDEVLSSLRQGGYLGANISEQYGGKGWDSMMLSFLHEEIGKSCSSIRSLLTVHGMVAYAIQKWGSPEQKKRWLPDLASGVKTGAFALTEKDAGSDASALRTEATQDELGYIINGAKKWTTYGQTADLLLVFARLEGEITAFIVEGSASGLTRTAVTGLLGLRGSMTADLTFENCRIPKENLLGRKGAGLSHVVQFCLDYGRFSIACGCVGIAQASLEASLRYSGERKQFERTLIEHQLIQKMITEMEVHTSAARLLCRQAAYSRDTLHPDCVLQTWKAKYFASITASQAAKDAVQIHGANGCSSLYPVERYMRDAKIMEIIEGTNQIHELMISSYTFGQFN
ncbi:acyl-CoA dehydrogenase family protein [Paenibacillus sp. FJAT-26967]|uniref:acyl-CoA dehydrogenase family protein n=1 Tax=Paenibacillus sp. FJAT-26967 TaxID=1729690 RepID=UPI00083811DC|nr:acyl-CoA dehydrogenase family protein [Paenibacillus sp. FJAT-26967]